MTFDQQYYRINDARLQGKLLVSGQKWQDFVEDRKKLAPIERLQFRYWLHTYTETVNHRVRYVYHIRKKGKHIGNVDMLKHFRGIE